MNNAPLGTDGAVTTNEDTPYTFTQSDFGFTDVDVPDSLVGGADRHLAGRGHADPVGQRGHRRSGDHRRGYHRGNLVYTPPANANGAGFTSFTFSVRDAASAYDPAANTLTVNVTAVNDAPTLDLDANNSSGATGR